MTQREPAEPRRLQAKPLERRSIAIGPRAAGWSGEGRAPASAEDTAAQIGRAELDERLRRLSEIGQVLAREVPAAGALPDVAAIVGRALPLRAMVLVMGTRQGPRTTTWSQPGGPARDGRVARSQALRWSAYLGGGASWSARELFEAPPERPRLHRAGRRMREVGHRAVTMPIGAAGRDVLGALLRGPEPPLVEDDLIFLNQVAGLFAGAIHRERQRGAQGSPPPTDSAAGALDEVAEGVLVVDDRGRIGFASPTARRLLGTESEALEGRDVHDVLTFRRGPGADGGSSGSAEPRAEGSPVTRALRLGISSKLAEHEVAGGRRDLPLRCTVVPLRAGELPAGPSGAPAAPVTGAVVMLRDAATARRSEQTRRFLARSAATLVTSLEPEETLEAVTRLPVPVLADLCGIDRFADDGTIDRRPPVCAHDLERRSRWSIVRRGAPTDWESPQDQVLRRGETLFCGDVHDTFVAADADGGDGPTIEIPIRAMVVVPLKARGRLLGAMTFAMTDSRRRFSPSDLRDLEEVADRTANALESASVFKREQIAARSREDILAVVSHDLRNPLGVVIGGAALLLEMPLADERRRRMIQAIQRAAQRMRRLIGDLLDASCLDGGRLSMEIGRQPADALVHDAVEMVSHPPPSGRRLQFVADADAVAGASVVCDRDRILQVFSNLIGNAIDFTPDGGTIRIGARRQGDDVVFFVADDGPGIAPQHLPHVFERFWQLRRSPGPRKGLGLGLPIAQGIVETHGGRIWVDSVEGRGSTFFFSLHAVLTPSRPA